MASPIRKAPVTSNVQRLLAVIAARGDVHELVRTGLTYSQIAVMLRDLIDHQLVVEDDAGLRLTADGASLVSEQMYDLQRAKGSWIRREESSIIDPLPDDMVYLPIPHSSFFRP